MTGVYQRTIGVGVNIGLWDGSVLAKDGSLLYRCIVKRALSYGLSGATVLRAIEGGNHKRVFRSIESEVASNELPVWLQFISSTGEGYSWAASLANLVSDKGVVVLSEHLDFTSGNSPQITHSNRAGEGESLASEVPAQESSPQVTSHRTARDDASYPGLQVSIYTLEKNKVNGKPVYQAVAEYLRRHDTAWVATMRGVYGYGEDRLVRFNGWFHREDTPVMMIVVDEESKLAPLVSGLIALVGSQAVVVTASVRWIHPLRVSASH